MEQEQEHRLCVIGFEASQQAHICRLASAPQIFVGAFLYKSSELWQLCAPEQKLPGQELDRAVRTMPEAQRKSLQPSYRELTPAAYHSLPSVRFLCVSPAFLWVSSKSWSSSNTCRYCCALSGMQLAWLASFCQLARERLHFQAITCRDSTEKTSIIQHYSIALIITQILSLGSFASSQVCTGAWLTRSHKFSLFFTTE